MGRGRTGMTLQPTHDGRSSLRAKLTWRRTQELVVLTIHHGRNATSSTLYTRTLLISGEDYAEFLEKDMWRLWLFGSRGL